MSAADEMVMKVLVEQIIIRDTGIEVCLKCGVSVEQEYPISRALGHRQQMSMVEVFCV
jgi:hypothetical protein